MTKLPLPPPFHLKFIFLIEEKDKKLTLSDVATKDLGVRLNLLPKPFLYYLISPQGFAMDLQQLSDIICFIILQEIIEQFFVVFLCFDLARRHTLRRRCRDRCEVRFRMIGKIPKIVSHISCIINDSDRICIDKLRINRNGFYKLVYLVKDNGGLTDGKYMSSSEKLAMFLNILAHHEKNRSIKVDYIRSGWSVSQAFKECLRAILKLTPLLLVNPKVVLEDETEDRWKWFKDCLGALDGTYVPIRVPSEYKPRYRTRKGEIATNVLGVCDRNLNFLYALPGWEGSAADGRVLRDAIVQANSLKVPEGNYYLCDGGYTNGNGFLSPYRGYRYWLRDWQGGNPPPQCREKLFNMRHARARNVIERAFGLLKGRWGILRSSSWYSVKVHNRIISACCLIHNFIRREMEADPLEVGMEEQVEYLHENINVVESSNEWTTWRDELAQEMWDARSND